MLNREITKVFHSCKLDMESLLTVFKDIPAPIFDTQIAAMFCTYYYDFVGYSKLIEQYMGITLDKLKAKNSDWLKRPLSQEQLDYAINDVTYLYDLYQILCDKLEESDKANWFQEEMTAIGDINRYIHNPKNAWKRIKFNQPQLMLTVKAISEWQETLAQRYNVDRNKIVNNAVIIDLIERRVERVDEILDELKKKTKNIKEEDLLEFINIFNDNEKDCVQHANVSLDNYDKSIFDILSIILEVKCKENNMSRKLVASKDELIKSISGQTNDLFRGWRYDFFGKSVKSFMDTDLKFEISSVKSADNIARIHSRQVKIEC
ncbi:Ribonuclease H-like domain,3'-5' exonuclease domain,HRDC-like [Cinara cedri]|uniref:Ribonuclease H-like domain,3'-5' exonuclease domain,HRDC-like n=1 Tax=Cinara cedri TaxID=506608 RepID=A0A5E4NGB6_9HEMI|nr:Ribonuclease H-like domain,3'-5' exonuclease domain,HRDC-like [Cinara cedri]